MKGREGKKPGIRDSFLSYGKLLPLDTMPSFETLQLACVLCTRQVPLNSKVKLSGSMIASQDGVPVRVETAYVRQDDVFFPQLTVSETLETSIALSDGMSSYTVEDLLRDLGLVKSKDTAVGSIKKRGISGGERKRLNIGCEITSDPMVILADEPTSGLVSD